MNKKIVTSILAVALIATMSTSVFAQVKTTNTSRYGVLRGEFSTAIASTSVQRNPGDGVLSINLKLVDANGVADGEFNEQVGLVKHLFLNLWQI